MKRNGIYRIAELAKVSIGTVDRALHGRPGIREETRQKILRIAEQLAYTPNPAARALSVGQSSLRIGVCIPREIHYYYDQVRAGIAAESTRAGTFNVELVHKPVLTLGMGEKKQFSALLNSDVQAIITTPGNPEIVGPLIDMAEERDIRVICTTTDAPNSRRSSIVAVDPELSGRLAAELMAKFLPPRSTAAVITGMLNTQEHWLKAKGFSVGFSSDCQDSQVVSVLEGHESEDETYLKTCDLLSRHSDLNGIYVSTVNCLPVCRALKKHNLAGRVVLIATDLFPEMVPHLRQGTIRASIYQNPYLLGLLAMRILLDHFTKRIPIPPSNPIGPALVLRSNLHLFREVQEKEKAPAADLAMAL